MIRAASSSSGKYSAMLRTKLAVWCGWQAAAVLAQIEGVEVVAAVDEEVGEVGLEEIIVVPVEVEDGLRPVGCGARRRTRVAKTGPSSSSGSSMTRCSIRLTQDVDWTDLVHRLQAYPYQINIRAERVIHKPAGCPQIAMERGRGSRAGETLDAYERKTFSQKGMTCSIHR